MVPGFLSELQGHANFPGDVWCQDTGRDPGVEDDLDLPEVSGCLQALVDVVQSYGDGCPHSLCSGHDTMGSLSSQSLRLNTK